ncbi:MAG: efflux RND transporter periplasmic adaptor subunit [Acidobacteriota bacterium]
MRIKVVFWAALTAAAVLSGCTSTTHANPSAKAADAPGATVKVAVSETRTVPIEIKTIGSVDPVTTIVVRARIGGALTKVYFTEGQLVKKDELLFEIDPRPYQEAIRQAEANIARDRALMAQDEANLASAEAQEAHYGKQAERYVKLAEQGIFSREQADQAEVEARARRTRVKAERAGIDSAKASIVADQSALDTAKLNLAYCTIRSPITGRTGQILVKQDNLVKANDVDLVTIHQVQPVNVIFGVIESYLPTIRARMGRLPVTATVPNTSLAPSLGSVVFMDNMVDRNSGTIRLKAVFPNADAKLWPGQFVDVSVKLEEQRNAVVVPGNAVQVGQNGSFVYVVKADKTVEVRPVKTGARLDRLVTILEGLDSGETVVTEGQIRLAPGARVRIES